MAFAARRLLALLGLLALLPAGSTTTTQNGRPGSWKVDTFVVLYMENRCARALSLLRSFAMSPLSSPRSVRARSCSAHALRPTLG